MPRKLSRALAAIGGMVCFAAAAPGTALAAECPVQPTSKAFAQFGDMNDYYLAPGGAFETLAWQQVGPVDLSLDADPFRLAPGVRSVRLQAGGAVSTSFCVDRTMPHLRFVAKGSGGDLYAEVRTTYGWSKIMSARNVAQSRHADWAPSDVVNLHASSIPAGESGTTTVTLRSQGEWRIDNLFVDPYRR